LGARAAAVSGAMSGGQDSGDGLNPVWLASVKLRRRKYDDCIAICSGILEKNPYDQVSGNIFPLSAFCLCC
jgi:hypothetical protein